MRKDTHFLLMVVNDKKCPHKLRHSHVFACVVISLPSRVGRIWGGANVDVEVRNRLRIRIVLGELEFKLS